MPWNFTPKDDITALEVANSLAVILCDEEGFEKLGKTSIDFIQEHGLERHFIWEEDE